MTGKTIFKRFRLPVPGQFKEVNMKPLRHELRQRLPVIRFRDRGRYHDERSAFTRLHDVQARERQVNETSRADGWLNSSHETSLLNNQFDSVTSFRSVTSRFPLNTYSSCLREAAPARLPDRIPVQFFVQHPYTINIAIPYKDTPFPARTCTSLGNGGCDTHDEAFHCVLRSGFLQAEIEHG